MPDLMVQEAPESLEPHIRAQANQSMARGGLYFATFSLLSAVVIGPLGLLRPGVAVLAPFGETVVGAITATVIWQLGRREKLVGAVAWAAAIALASQPLFIMLFAHFTISPSGTLTFLSGPAVILYGDLIVLTGLFFNPTITRAVGLICAVELLGSYFLERHALFAPPLAQPVDELRQVAPMLAEDVFGFAATAMKAAMIAACGFFTAAFAATARKLIVRILTEEREKQGITRLFGQFVSPAVREKILREKAETIGERKQVVVLFSDLRGFSSWSEATDPAVLVAQLNEYFDAMVAAITRNGGVVDKFIGDAVMAVFGGLIELPNPSDAAVSAAREMRTSLARLNEKWKSEGRRELENGIGIHFGEVLQGTLGSNDRKEFTVIGDAVNTASRLESATKELGHTVVVSAAVYDAVTSKAALTALGPVALKGKAQPVSVYAVS